MPFGVEKTTEWFGDPIVKMLKISPFDRIHERDGRTPHDDIGRACIASCGKNGDFYQHLALTISWSVECSQHAVSTMR